LRAARLLERADIVFYDALVHPEIVALAARAEKIAVGKRCGRHSAAQRFINKRLIDAAALHTTIVRLKGGDPMLFGRAQEEIDALQAAGVTVGSTPASAYLTNAAAQTISRSDLVNDVEINWLYSLWERPEFLSQDPAAPSRRINLMWLAGFRFFQLEDVLTQTSFPGGGAPGTLDLGVATNNNLYGAQVGAKFDWRLFPQVRFSSVPKFMIAGNSITNTTTLATGSGTQAVFASGAPVNVHSTLGVFSWLGSVDTGVAWDVTDRWTLSMGYRVVGVGNIAQADGQWPPVISSPASISGIDAGSSTIIHGGFAGFEGRY
jgi:hypothetical protein